MNPKLVKGANLTARQLEQVRRAFVHRHIAIGEGKAYPTERAWIEGHAFYIRKDGNIASRPGHCEPVYLAEE